MKNTKTSLVLGNDKQVTDNTVATRANSPHFQSFANEEKRESLQSLPNLLPFGAEDLAGLPNLLNLPFSDFRSQSNTNDESTRSTDFRIGTNQTHPNI